MGIFGNFFENKKGKESGMKGDNSKDEKGLINMTKEGIVKRISIDASGTPDKFKHHTTEILDLLIEKLLELHKFERDVFDRSQKLKNPNEPNQVQPGEDELWEEYRNQRRLITATICLNPDARGSSMFGKPTKYEYLTYSDTIISFTMKSADRAVVEVNYEYGIKKKDQFVFTKVNESWKLATKKYGFQNEAKWYKDEL